MALSEAALCACGKAIGRRSKTGLCRSCGMRRALAHPGAHHRLVERNRRNAAAMTDAERERRREHGRWLVREKIKQDDWARSQTPEVRARVGRANTERTLGWCPAAKRDEYRQLRISLRYSAAEARAIIEADLAVARAKEAAETAQTSKRPPTLEEQLARLAAGARLVPNIPLRKPDPAGTLGGVASGML